MAKDESDEPTPKPKAKKSSSPPEVGDTVSVYAGSASSALADVPTSPTGTFDGTVTAVNDDGTLDIVVTFTISTTQEIPLSHVSPLSDELTPETYGGHLYE